MANIVKRRNSNTPDVWRGSSWSPFREISRLQRGLDRMFEDFFSPVVRGSDVDFDLEEFGFSPLADIEETESHYIVRFDLPGVSKEDVRIEMRDNQLIVAGERKREEVKEEGSRLRTERYHGTFQRVFMLPSNVEAEKIEANYRNGVLDVFLPKAESSKSKLIQIKEARGERKESKEKVA